MDLNVTAIRRWLIRLEGSSDDSAFTCVPEESRISSGFSEAVYKESNANYTDFNSYRSTPAIQLLDVTYRPNFTYPSPKLSLCISSTSLLSFSHPPPPSY